MSGVHHYPYTICGKGGHSASRCKEIGIPPDGFYKPQPGQHQHDEDENESYIQISIDELVYAYKKWIHMALKYREQTTKTLFLP